MSKIGYLQLCGLFTKQLADDRNYRVQERTVIVPITIEGFSTEIELSRPLGGDGLELTLNVTDSFAVYYNIPIADTHRYQSVAEAFVAYMKTIEEYRSRETKVNDCFNRLVKLIGEINISNVVHRKEGTYYSDVFNHLEAKVLKDRIAVYDRSVDETVELLLDVDCSKDKTMYDALNSLLRVRHNQCSSKRN